MVSHQYRLSAPSLRSGEFLPPNSIMPLLASKKIPRFVGYEYTAEMTCGCGGKSICMATHATRLRARLGDKKVVLKTKDLSQQGRLEEFIRSVMHP